MTRFGPILIAHWPLVCVVLAFLVLGTLYSVATPIFEASDEMHHYRFAEHIRLYGELPVQTGAVPTNLPKQESSQPPLYYMLMATVPAWSLDEPAEIKVNRHATTGVPLAITNKNMVLHTPAERFPYTGVALTVHVLRLVSLLMAAVSVALTYALTLRLAPGNRAVAAGAASLIAFIPMYLFISASINNDNLVIVLSSVAILLMVRALQGHHSLRDFAVLGLVLGLGALSKLSALGLFGVLAFICVYLGVRERELRRFMGRGALALSIAGLVSGWWYLRNLVLYGEPLGIEAMLTAVGRRRSTPTIWELASELEGLRINFWGLFGGVNVLLDEWYYRIYDTLAILALLGLVVYVIRVFREKQQTKIAVLGVLFLWPAVVSVSLARWTTMTLASQGRLLFPALSAVCVLAFLGLSALAPRRLTPVLAGLVAALMIVLAAMAPFRSIMPAYSPHPSPDEAELATITRPSHAVYGEAIELLGCRLSPETVKPGEVLEIDLYWRSLHPVEEDYSVFVHLIDRDGIGVGQVDATPGRGMRQTSLWQPGEIIRDRYEVPVSFDVATPGLLWVQVGLYHKAELERLWASDPTGEPLGTSVSVAVVKVAADQQIVHHAKPSVASYVEMGGDVAMLGFDLADAVAEPGGTVRGSIYWRALRQIERDYTVFVQLVGPHGLIGQYDSQPMENGFPTSYWDEGEIVVDPFVIDVSPDAAPGEYQLIAGMYELSSGERLLSQEGDHQVLGTVLVR